MFRSKAAVVGTGFIGPVHIEALMRSGVSVHGVLGTSHEKSQRVATKYGIPYAYRTFEELLNDSQIQVVHLTSPNRFHYAQTIQCIEAGKHVICEKPLSMNSTESYELVRRAQHSNVKTGVNYNVRFYPVCIEAAERVRRGDLGDVFHVTGSYVQDWLHLSSDFNWRVLSSEGGPLRALADIGTHWLDLVQTICLLDVQSVCADVQTVYQTRYRPTGNTETFSGKTRTAAQESESIAIDTEDFGSVLLRFANGARGVMHVSQVTAGHKNLIRWEIAGSRESMAWNSQRPDELWIGHRESANELLLRDPGLLSPTARVHAEYPGGHNEGFPDTFKQLFRSFYSAIEDEGGADSSGLAPYPTFEDGHREIVLCEAILKSAREKRWVDVVDQGSPST